MQLYVYISPPSQLNRMFIDYNFSARILNLGQEFNEIFLNNFKVNLFK
jgi:hypothetical protein